MIDVRSVQHSYKGQKSLRFADWNITKGERWLLLGKSGSGKTTLLHIITGLLRPEQGIVEINNQDIYKLKDKELDRFRGRNIGIVFQIPHFIRGLTIAENLLAAQTFAGYPSNRQRITETLESLGIADQQNKHPYQLSQGQLQRVSIARAVINRPALIIADEPTSSLDDQNAETVTSILAEQTMLTDATLVVATHDQRIKNRFDKIYSLDNGTVQNQL